MEQVVITEQHKWLSKFVGDWAYEGSCPCPEGGESFEFKGTEHVRSIGGVWIHGEGRSVMPDGTPSIMLLTVGYDAQKGRYVGTWAGSMMTHMFVYEGWVEDDGRTLVLETTGPCCMKDSTDSTKTRTYRDITEFVTDDHRAFRSEMLGDDGVWTKMMGFDMHRVSVPV